jgi:microsomal dipeptidase-like Zn-dependent dipeptidase
MPVSVQKELRDQGALFERCYISATDFNIPLEQIAAEIREVGIESTVLATDFGQNHNISPPDGLAEYAENLAEFGFSQENFDQMLRHNPAFLLGLDG